MWRTSGLHGSVRLVKLASTKLARARHLLSGVESDRKCVNNDVEAGGTCGEGARGLFGPIRLQTRDGEPARASSMLT